MNTRVPIRLAWCVALLALTVGPARADTLELKDGTQLVGKLISFDGQKYIFLDQEQKIQQVPAVNVASFVVANPTGPALEQKLDDLSTLIEEGAAQNQSGPETTEPGGTLSGVFVSEDQEEWNGQQCAVRGMVNNQCPNVLRGLEVQVDLLDELGRVVVTQSRAIMASALGPGGRSRFRVLFENPPKFTRHRVFAYQAGNPAESVSSDASRKVEFKPNNLNPKKYQQLLAQATPQPQPPGAAPPAEEQSELMPDRAPVALPVAPPVAPSAPPLNQEELSPRRPPGETQNAAPATVNAAPPEKEVQELPAAPAVVVMPSQPAAITATEPTAAPSVSKSTLTKPTVTPASGGFAGQAQGSAIFFDLRKQKQP